VFCGRETNVYAGLSHLFLLGSAGKWAEIHLAAVVSQARLWPMSQSRTDCPWAVPEQLLFPQAAATETFQLSMPAALQLTGVTRTLPSPNVSRASTGDLSQLKTHGERDW